MADMQSTFHRAYRAARGLCPRCGYDVRASTGVCPECGLRLSPLGESAAE